MNYFKIIYRTGEQEWETSEIIVNEEQNTKIQKQMADGSDFIFIKDKATIKRTAVVSIASANNVVAEYQKSGMAIPGLLAVSETPRLTGEVKKAESIKDFLARTSDAFKKKMGWDKKIKSPEEVLKAIEQRSFENENLKTDELGF